MSANSARRLLNVRRIDGQVSSGVADSDAMEAGAVGLPEVVSRPIQRQRGADRQLRIERILPGDAIDAVYSTIQRKIALTLGLLGFSLIAHKKGRPREEGVLFAED